jgi:PII-like signaling protein
MKIEGKATMLAVYIGESDHWHGKPLYEAIVEKARELGLAGATVTRGIMGFGANSHIHTASILRLSEDLSVVVQIIDQNERIELLAEELTRMVTEGLVVSWEVNAKRYVHSPSEGPL